MKSSGDPFSGGGWRVRPRLQDFARVGSRDRVDWRGEEEEEDTRPPARPLSFRCSQSREPRCESERRLLVRHWEKKKRQKAQSPPGTIRLTSKPPVGLRTSNLVGYFSRHQASSSANYGETVGEFCLAISVALSDNVCWARVFVVESSSSLSSSSRRGPRGHRPQAVSQCVVSFVVSLPWPAGPPG